MSYYGFSSLYQNTEYQIKIYSFSINETVTFPAFVTDYNDSFKSNWTTQEIYGRMDPIATFKNTSRTINLAFDIPNSDIINAKENLSNLDTIIKGLYPVYDERLSGSSNISAPPLFRIEMSNLICNVQTGEGLLGYLNGFDFKPEMNSGHFIDSGIIYPKLLKASFTFNVLHEHALGTKVIGNKHVPRIKVGEGFSYAFAHKYDKRTFVGATTPASGSTSAATQQATTPSNEIQLYTSRLLESGPNAAPQGRIYQVSPTSMGGKPPERFTLVNTTNVYKVYKSSDGQLIGIPINRNGGSVGFTTTPNSPAITELAVFNN